MLLFTYYGHAAFALNNAKRKLLFDPFFTGNPAATTAADVITCNYILVSHGHGDHLLLRYCLAAMLLILLLHFLSE